MSKTNSKKPPDGRGKYARSEETRTRILDAALEECAQAGFHKASMASIAARAEVAVGILNYHFGSRQEMLREMMTTYAAHFQSAMSLTQTGQGFYEYAVAILETYLAYLHANPEYIKLAEEIRRHEPELYQEGKDAQFAGIIYRIERGIEGGEIPIMGTDEIRIRAHLILGAYTFLDRLLEDEKYPGDDFVITVVMSMLRNGLSTSS